MRVAVTSQDGARDFDFAQGGPWESFGFELERLGHLVVSLDANPDAIIFNNYSYKLFKKFGARVPRGRRVLIAWEPPSNLPSMYKWKNLAKFDNRFFPSPYWSKEFGGYSFDWPQGTSATNLSHNWLLRSDKCCMIQGNRWNLNHGNLYAFRRELARKMEFELDIYGHDWNRGFTYDSKKVVKNFVVNFPFSRVDITDIKNIGFQFPNYIGAVKEKLDTLLQYKYTVVCENSLQYVSEKLIDAILAGTVPIYIGPNLKEFGFPEGIALSIPPTTSSVIDAFQLLRNDRRTSKRILAVGKDFLATDRYRQIQNREVLTKLSLDVANNLK